MSSLTHQVVSFKWMMTLCGLWVGPGCAVVMATGFCRG